MIFDGIEKSPGKETVARLRSELGITQARAAEIAGVALITWQQYEYGKRSIPRAVWAAFLLETDSHPVCKLIKK